MKMLDLTSIEGGLYLIALFNSISSDSVSSSHIQVFILSKLKLFHSFELLNKVIAFV